MQDPTQFITRVCGRFTPASVGAFFFVALPASYSVRHNGCVTPLAPDGLMVTSRSHLSVMTEAPVLPRAGASSWSASVGLTPGRLPLVYVTPARLGWMWNYAVARAFESRRLHPSAPTTQSA